jgi:hypothetical protein
MHNLVDRCANCRPGLARNDLFLQVAETRGKTNNNAMTPKDLFWLQSASFIHRAVIPAAPRCAASEEATRDEKTSFATRSFTEPDCRLQAWRVHTGSVSSGGHFSRCWHGLHALPDCSPCGRVAVVILRRQPDLTRE